MGYSIPVVLILFKRFDTLEKILDRIRCVKPQKVYLLSDEGRNENEKNMVKKVRNFVESSIDWDCKIIKKYATKNEGVYNNIALGAKWVFEREEKAIFLEDDNLPEVTFFNFCEEMLNKYADDNRILWICGTNYLGKYSNKSGESYMFTQHLLPCGWASWSSKFLENYDFKLETYNKKNLRKVKNTMYNKKLFNQISHWVEYEKSKYMKYGNFFSWDYHMAWSLINKEMLGISPAFNQIKNIGVDEISTHGGSSLSQEMTRRFCGMDSYPLSFPLVHPKNVTIDQDYEKKIEKIILLPLKNRIRTNASAFLHHMLKKPLCDKILKK